MIRKSSLLCAANLALVGAPLAHAQTQPPPEDIVVQGEILNRAIDQAADAPRNKSDDSSNEIDGEAGIYVLTTNEIFFIAGSGGVGHTTNPTRTSTDSGEDWYGDLSVSAGVSTRLGGAMDFSAIVNVDARDYLEADAASSRSVSATTALGMPLFDVAYGSIVAFGGYAFDDQFDNETGFYGLSANLSTNWKISDQILLRPGIGVTQQWSDVSENNSLSATASLDAIYAISSDWLASARVSVSQRDYDDFYEDVTFVEREDTTVGISATLAWRPWRNTTVSASVAYENQDSTFFLSEFDAFNTAVSASLRHMF